MSGTKILAHNEHGYMIECQNCGNYQLGFGTTVVCISSEQFAEFRLAVEEQSVYYRSTEFPDQKKIQLTTFSRNSHFILSYNELLKLQELVEEANIMVEVHKLFTTEN